jgi:hypothetical protein
VSCRDPHRSFELGCSERKTKNKQIVLAGQTTNMMDTRYSKTRLVPKREN